MKNTFRLISLLIWFGVTSNILADTFYKCKAKNGITTFSDTEVLGSQCTLLKKELHKPSPSSKLKPFSNFIYTQRVQQNPFFPLKYTEQIIPNHFAANRILKYLNLVGDKSWLVFEHGMLAFNENGATSFYPSKHQLRRLDYKTDEAIYFSTDKAKHGSQLKFDLITHDWTEMDSSSQVITEILSSRPNKHMIFSQFTKLNDRVFINSPKICDPRCKTQKGIYEYLPEEKELTVLFEHAENARRITSFALFKNELWFKSYGSSSKDTLSGINKYSFKSKQVQTKFVDKHFVPLGGKSLRICNDMIVIENRLGFLVYNPDIDTSLQIPFIDKKFSFRKIGLSCNENNLAILIKKTLGYGWAATSSYLIYRFPLNEIKDYLKRK